MNQLHTTNSWRFLGVDSIPQYNKLTTDVQSNVIVGVIDSGVWPESRSFNDYGLGPVPKRFKGECVTGQNFTRINCNRKIIGARYYNKGYEAVNGPLENTNQTFFRSPRDSDGHGTHASSTIVGSKVSNVSVYGLGLGTARGGVPSARLSVYKACWFGGCEDADLLAAFSDAIHDGVDVLSISLGQRPPQQIYFEDPISIGSFHAFQNGIVVSASAGNKFFPGAAINVAPWILTVGASTVDREFPSYLLLGNLRQLKGFGINTTPDQDRGKLYSIISGSVAAASGIPSTNASFCKNNTLDSNLIKGRIVVCMLETLNDDRKEKAIAIKEAGGVGMILIDPLAPYVLFQTVVQSVLIGKAEAAVLQSYMDTEKNPTARIYLTVTSSGIKPAPVMAIFSSKGPNIISPDIIKPDITAPGVNILAAWSPLATKNTLGNHIDYNLLSGTSMSCPHAAAVAALLKSAHPYWSPAAIKSAIMTTATLTDNTQNFIRNDDSTIATPFDYGSGHINPAAAIDPGLIYDFDTNNLIELLCSYGASYEQLKKLTDTPVYCKNPPTPSYNFNYPSIGVANMAGNVSVYRTVTYIGEGPTSNSYYVCMLSPVTYVKHDNEDVISVFESRMNRLHTTNSWRFLGIDSIPQYNKLPTDIQSDVIVGVIDSGVWPESQSFNDYGLGPVPTRFKGECVLGQNFTRLNCNRKLVGARYYSKAYEAVFGPLENSNQTFFRSARDSDGHGTHTSSTIAGSKVSNVSLYGLGSGTARGGVPSARLSIYKPCWFDDCEDADILAAFSDAIHDGVDIISISLGQDPPQQIYFEEAISIGSFHAFQKGIVVSASAGNSFFPSTATNVAPWILTVGASTIDREFPSYILLGNLKRLKAFGVNTKPDQGKQYGIISGGDAATSGIPSINASFCKRNTLDSNSIKGKIVVCMLEELTDDRFEKLTAIEEGGGAGMILIDPLAKYVLRQSVIQSVFIGEAEAKELQKYMKTQKNPTARIYRTVTNVGTKPAPAMAIFSSKGPNVITPDIIKPDITAPGVNILAAWSPVSTKRTAGNNINYNIISGTSMSCPHVSAVAALLKSLHPYWSPAAIKSAIMTTATTIDNTRNLITNDDSTNATPFDYGSGHINPAAAIDPGLIYDFDTNNLIEFLCSYGATVAQLKNLTDTPVYCKSPPTPSYNFNYPSIGVANMAGNVSVYRTVTYVGEGPTVYFSKLEVIAGVKAWVYPDVLRFTKSGEKMTYRIDFVPYKSSNGSFVFGSLTWRNDVHMVRSPIAINVC
ncbi:hypothetical protein M8C21_023259 [Ambrosia artemisiifolia]|uniref:Uncharacterized protein n=1 Tax=Ambrosia artemisiifolia TaxID=4212 RepID=A0AAD5D4K7_AMBAR|nr:hypothetical protein M8C21_023259 [Ambrosia artemisiifolia]